MKTSVVEDRSARDRIKRWLHPAAPAAWFTISPPDLRNRFDHGQKRMLPQDPAHELLHVHRTRTLGKTDRAILKGASRKV